MQSSHLLAERLLALSGALITVVVLVGNFGHRAVQLWVLLAAIVVLGGSIYLYSKTERKK